MDNKLNKAKKEITPKEVEKTTSKEEQEIKLEENKNKKPKKNINKNIIQIFIFIALMIILTTLAIFYFISEVYKTDEDVEEETRLSDLETESKTLASFRNAINYQQIYKVEEGYIVTGIYQMTSEHYYVTTKQIISLYDENFEQKWSIEYTNEDLANLIYLNKLSPENESVDELNEKYSLEELANILLENKKFVSSTTDAVNEYDGKYYITIHNSDSIKYGSYRILVLNQTDGNIITDVKQQYDFENISRIENGKFYYLENDDYSWKTRDYKSCDLSTFTCSIVGSLPTSTIISDTEEAKYITIKETNLSEENTYYYTRYLKKINKNLEVEKELNTDDLIKKHDDFDGISYKQYVVSDNYIYISYEIYYNETTNYRIMILDKDFNYVNKIKFDNTCNKSECEEESECYDLKDIYYYNKKIYLLSSLSCDNYERLDVYSEDGSKMITSNLYYKANAKSETFYSDKIINISDDELVFYNKNVNGLRYDKIKLDD